MGEIRRTIVPAAKSISEARLRRWLPPDHRIVAVRHDGSHGFTDYLIEGPLVPDAAEAVPVFTMTIISPDKMRMTGRWESSGEEWVVGEWSSMDAYREEMEALDG